ncbi:sugar transferase [Paucilactobacillus nenjiangensis]|nr:sugar transferase [Paucilactobacillus nenjiangensis]
MTDKKIQLTEKPFYTFFKRLFDILFSMIGLIVLIPLFFIVSVCILIDDPKGPIFYSQTRVGKNGKAFKMYKFRSMVSNADEILEKLRSKNEISGAMFKLKNDPRITKVGRIIRKYSLDELPQLLNVIQGSMSLVGPRPPLLSEVAQYTEFDKQRLLVRPGCTGLWQVGGRNDVSFDEMVRLDLEYITHRSLLLDAQIIFKTVLVMLKPNGAY